MTKNELLREIIKICSPGTPLRLGLENIINANSGGLILLMNEEDIERHSEIIQPGFYVNCEYTPQKIYELAKMDGAVILNEDVTKILYANVQLAPDPSIPTSETGMRHRNAERTAKQTGKISIAVSRRRGVVSIYWGAFTYMLRDLSFLITMVNQGLKVIEKYRSSYNREIENLNVLEIEDNVTLSDVCRTIEKAVVPLKTADEIEKYIWEMGVNGRLARMQLDEMIDGLDESLHLIVSDYLRYDGIPEVELVNEVCEKIKSARDKDMGDYSRILSHLDIKTNSLLTEENVGSRGIRLLNTVTKIPDNIIYNLIETFGTLRNIRDANPEDLKEVVGIGEKRSTAIIEGLYKISQNRQNYFRL